MSDLADVVGAAATGVILSIVLAGMTSASKYLESQKV